jgi:hypothetical protein
LTDAREGIEQDEQDEQDNDRRAPIEAATRRRVYAAPALVEYGTVAKLTQTGSGSVADFFGMRRMMACL